MGIFGLMIGSFAAGPLLVYGRRRTIILANFVMIIPIALLQIANLRCLCVAKFIYGICCGPLNVCMGRCIAETIPIRLSGQFGTATNTYLCFGLGASSVIGVMLP